MMDRLGDLLRMTLDTSNIQEVPLKDELEMLQKYLDIEQVALRQPPDASTCASSRRRWTRWCRTFCCSRSSKTPCATALLPTRARAGSPSRPAARDSRLTIRIRDSGDGVAPHRLTLLNQGVGLDQHPRAARASLSAAITRSCSRTTSGFCVTVTHPVHGGPRAWPNPSKAVLHDQKIRTLVVDDEPIARARVVSLLRDEADIELVGECANGQQARVRHRARAARICCSSTSRCRRCDGFDLARTIQAHGMPAVVFVTAYDEYALRAFEVHALDYLLKPFSAERFRSALGHAREHLAEADGGQRRRHRLRRAAARDAAGGRAAQSPDDQVGRPHSFRPDRPTSTGARPPATTSACTSASRSTWCATR